MKCRPCKINWKNRRNRRKRLLAASLLTLRVRIMSVEIALVVLIGLPGSGKTTLSKMLCDFLESADNFNLIIPICYDSVIPVSSITFEDGCGKSWKEDRKNVLKNVSLLIRHLRGVDGICMTSMFDSTLSVLRSTPSSERRRIFILIDDNMFYRSMRYEYYQVARLYSTGFCQLYVRCDVKDALKRNSSRELAASVPEDVILRMVEKLEPPSDCNFWEKSSLIINSERWTHEKIAEICEFVINVTRSPELAQKDCAEMREESRAHCSANVMHQVDIALRRLVGERMKEGKQKNLTPKDLQIRSKALADLRQLVVQGIKIGTIEVPQEIQESVQQQFPDSKSKLQHFLNDFFVLHQL